MKHYLIYIRYPETYSYSYLDTIHDASLFEPLLNWLLEKDLQVKVITVLDDGCHYVNHFEKPKK